jgi:hypothetical protein
MPALVDLTGLRFGRLTVTHKAESRNLRNPRNKCTRWTCQCDCGNRVTVYGSSLKRKLTQSCGCLGLERFISRATTHGLSKSPEYGVWMHMRNRCHKPKNKRYKDYGGRGITVCSRWRNSFENFLADMGTRPSPIHSINRKDNNKGYSPDNCCWSTKWEQQRNMRNNRWLEAFGRRKILSDWARDLGFHCTTIHHYLKTGRTLEDFINAHYRR